MIIPLSLQAQLLQELHWHGKNEIIHMWWPRMDSNIEEIVRSCNECAAQRGLLPVVPLHSWPWAKQPMKRLHIDFAEIEGLQVLIMIDVHSKWIEAKPLHTATASTTIQALQTFFQILDYQMKLLVITGRNSLHSNSKSFVNVMESNIPIPPYHPASNGAAGRAVQVVKSAMKKMTSPTSLPRKLAEFLLFTEVRHMRSQDCDLMNCFCAVDLRLVFPLFP